jgi:hypothetical protein
MGSFQASGFQSQSRTQPPIFEYVLSGPWDPGRSRARGPTGRRDVGDGVPAGGQVLPVGGGVGGVGEDGRHPHHGNGFSLPARTWRAPGDEGGSRSAGDQAGVRLVERVGHEVEVVEQPGLGPGDLGGADGGREAPRAGRRGHRPAPRTRRAASVLTSSAALRAFTRAAAARAGPARRVSALASSCPAASRSARRQRAAGALDLGQDGAEPQQDVLVAGEAPDPHPLHGVGQGVVGEGGDVGTHAGAGGRGEPPPPGPRRASGRRGSSGAAASGHGRWSSP